MNFKKFWTTMNKEEKTRFVKMIGLHRSYLSQIAHKHENRFTSIEIASKIELVSIKFASANSKLGMVPRHTLISNLKAVMDFAQAVNNYFAVPRDPVDSHGKIG